MFWKVKFLCDFITFKVLFEPLDPDPKLYNFTIECVLHIVLWMISYSQCCTVISILTIHVQHFCVQVLKLADIKKNVKTLHWMILFTFNEKKPRYNYSLSELIPFVSELIPFGGSSSTSGSPQLVLAAPALALATNIKTDFIYWLNFHHPMCR